MASNPWVPRISEPTPEPAPLAVNMNVAARMAGLSRRGLERFVKAGELRVAKIGGRTLVRVTDLEAWLKSKVRP